MKNLTKLIALLMALLMVLALTACGGKDSSSADSSAAPASDSSAKAPAAEGNGAGGATAEELDVEVGTGDTLNIGFYLNEVLIGSFDPTGAFSHGVCWGIVYMMYDLPLMTTANGLESRIFSEYGWLEDNLTFYGVIKDGVCFNNGDPVTPEDIIYSFKILEDGGSFMWNWYKFIDFENSYGDGQTLYLKCLHEYAAAESYINVAIINKDVMEARLDAVGRDFTAIDPYALDFTDGICSGPYKCVESVTESYATYVLREDWWGYEEYGAPMASVINGYYYGDQTTMGIDIQNGNIDVALNVAMTDAERANNGEYGDVKLGTSPQNGIYVYTFSEANADLKDLNLRKAIASCVNAEEIATVAMSFLAKPADCYFAPKTEGYISGCAYAYDVDAARAYLAASDHPNGVELNAYSQTEALQQTVLEMMQYYCQDINVTLNLNFVDAQSLGTYQAAGGVDMMVGSNGGMGNPAALAWVQINNFDSAQYPDTNFTGRTDLMELYNNAKYSNDFDYRVEQYHAIAQYFYENCIKLPLFESIQTYLYNDTLVDNDNSFIAGFVSVDPTLIALK